MNSTRYLLLCLLVMLAVTATAPAADTWRGLIVSDGPTPASSAPRHGVRVTYLGTNGYLLESRGATLLIDPYFTRAGAVGLALGLPLQPSAERIDAALARLPQKVDAILVTHAHIDHLLDAKPVAERTGARVLASPTGVHLVRAAGLQDGRALPMLPGTVRQVGSARITTLPAAHDRVFGCWTPFPGVLKREPEPPTRPGHWLCGEPLAFLIEMGGQRIYIESGGLPDFPAPRLSRPVDLAILGAALGDSRDRLGPMLASLRPRVFLPSHQDDFFRPLSEGFRFGLLTDFPRVRRIASARGVRLIMLDYFRPWTLR